MGAPDFSRSSFTIVALIIEVPIPAKPFLDSKAIPEFVCPDIAAGR
jgi:hypothetical protein